MPDFAQCSIDVEKNAAGQVRDKSDTTETFIVGV